MRPAVVMTEEDLLTGNGIEGGGRTHGIYVYIGVTHQAWVLEEGGEEGRK